MQIDREQRSTQCAANAEKLEQAIQALRTQHGEWLSGRVNYREFWEHSKAVAEMFRIIKPLESDDRARLWADLRDEMRRRQNAEHEARKSVSEQRRSAIMDCIHEAGHCIAGAPDLDYLRRADDLLDRAQQMMKGGWDHLGGGFQTALHEMVVNDGRLTREDREFCWEQLQDAWRRLKGRKEDLRQQAYEHGQRLAATAHNAAQYSDPYDALETIKQCQSEVKGLRMGKDRSEIVWRSLQDAWDHATARIREHKEEKRRRHEEWVARMHENTGRWEALIEKNEGVIERLRDQIADCEEKLAGARTSDYAAMVQGWIDEKEDKIRDIQSTNRELEARIHDVQSKLRG